MSALKLAWLVQLLLTDELRDFLAENEVALNLSGQLDRAHHRPLFFVPVVVCGTVEQLGLLPFELWKPAFDIKPASLGCKIFKDVHFCFICAKDLDVLDLTVVVR